MGYSGKLSEKVKAQELRKKGLSYQEILQYIHVSKGTVSNWCKDIELSSLQKEQLLYKKLFGQKRGSLIAAENKRKARIIRTQEIYKIALQEIGLVTERDHFMLGLSLYAAEGDKTDRKGAFTNADPRLIVFMMNWFRTVCKVPLSKLRGAIWIHEENDREKAKYYWSTLTGIPINQFHKTYVPKRKRIVRRLERIFILTVSLLLDSLTHLFIVK